MVIHAHMTRRDWRSITVFAVALVLLASGAAHVPAQGNQAKCRAALTRRGVASTDSIPCFSLAALVVDSLSVRAWIEPRDVQSTVAGNAAPAGTPAQTSAVPTIQPTALASATIAAVTQDSGSNAITAVSLNPLMLFSSSTDPNEIARITRLLDITVFFPAGGPDANKDGRLDYAGTRVRVNLTANSQSDALRRFQDELVSIVRNELSAVNNINSVMLKAPDPDRCADQLRKSDAVKDTIVSVCGVTVAAQLDEDAYARLRRRAAIAREEADARFVGLDIRFDVGDPTFGKVRNARATSVLGGIAFGRRFDPTATRATAGVRGRLAARYVNLSDTTVVDWQLDGGLALEASRLIDTQRLEISAGVEFRYSGNHESTEILRTRFAELRAGIVVPILGGTSIALTGSVPLVGEIGPTLSVSMNWQQLLAQALKR